jgi:hypothetical protein
VKLIDILVYIFDVRELSKWKPLVSALQGKPNLDGFMSAPGRSSGMRSEIERDQLVSVTVLKLQQQVDMIFKIECACSSFPGGN